MWRPDTEALAHKLGNEFGLALEGSAVETRGDWPAFELRPAGMRREIAFAARVALGWRSITFSLAPGAFAAPLVTAMGEADQPARQAFAQLASRCLESKSRVALEVNDTPVDPLSPGDWPGDWRKVGLSLVKSPAVVNTEDADANDSELHVWTRRYLSLALVLMPLEELEPAEAENPEGLPEGACVRVETNLYERSRINRAACIEVHGDSCLVCDFNFGREYGEVGRGFINVHHVVPVWRLGPGYRINPVTDLVPLCPNCHAMAHRFDPPASVDALRALLRRTAGFGDQDSRETV